jgi:integrase
MKGAIGFRKDREVWFVSWWDKAQGKQLKIYRYKGELMYHKKVARKLLSVMQSRTEDGIFRIDEFTGRQPTDVIPYLDQWLVDISPTLKPATIKDYSNSIKKHLIPFFKKHPIQLSEIQHDTLIQILNSIKRKGKGKQNVMYCLHACMDYAWRSGRIVQVPPFPKKKQYKIQEPIIQWVPSDRQEKILNAIPKEHQPIFWWVKLHFRRPGEACALHKVDLVDDVFVIKRTFSNRILTDSTKTGKAIQVECVDDFKQFMGATPKYLSPFFFVNPYARKPGKPYSLSSMEKIWNKACKEVGEHIKMYAGLKHSSCCQYLNEKGGSFSDLQEVTGHQRLESVKRYGEMQVKRRKELMERKVIRLDKPARSVENGK